MNYKYIIIDPGHGGVDLGRVVDEKNEKDFNLELGKSIYNKLKALGYPVYITRDKDVTLSNYDRYEYINELVGNNSTLVISIQIDDENKDDITVISSLKSNEDTNNAIYNAFNKIGVVKNKTLASDSSRDYYAMQRISPLNSDVVVIEFGYDYLNEKNLDISNSISDVIINYLGNNNDNAIDYDNYIVEKGDYLYKIANRYNTTVEVLRKINNLGTDFLNIGEILKVPRIINNIYVVKRGDSLYSIAKKYNKDIEKIKDINNLISNKLDIDQKLIIPD